MLKKIFIFLFCCGGLFVFVITASIWHEKIENKKRVGIALREFIDVSSTGKKPISSFTDRKIVTCRLATIDEIRKNKGSEDGDLVLVITSSKGSTVTFEISEYLRLVRGYEEYLSRAAGDPKDVSDDKELFDRLGRFKVSFYKLLGADCDDWEKAFRSL